MPTSLPPELDVDTGRTNPQAIEAEIRQPRGKLGIHEHHSERSHGLKSEEGVHGQDDGAGRPALGLVRGGVHTGVGMLSVPRNASQDFGQPVAGEQLGGVEHGPGQPVQLVDTAVAGQAESEGGVLHRPHAAPVVAEGVVGAVRRRQCAHAPAAEQVRLQQASGYHRAEVLGHDARGQHVPGIRGDRFHVGAVGAEGHGIELAIRHPERRLELLAQP